MWRALITAAIFICAIAATAHAQPEPRVAEASEARDAYWRAIDTQEYPAAYAMLTSGMQALSSVDQFSNDAARVRSDMGLAQERRVMRTTVYENPASAPEPGLYIAFDYVGRFEKADRNCGYIIMHQLAPGEPFRTTRTDQTFLANDQAAQSSLPADDLWTQMATSYCPGWQRSWAIQPPV